MAVNVEREEAQGRQHGVRPALNKSQKRGWHSARRQCTSSQRCILAMKRHLVFPQDFDTRAHLLSDVKDTWDEKVKKQHQDNKERLLASIMDEFGSFEFDKKIKNFKDMGSAPFSLVSFHNRFFTEIRNSFVVGSYYPALTGACALGERMLNHMILILRDDFKHTPEYKSVYRQDSFDNWKFAIDTLAVWGVIKGEAVTTFEQLKELRNRSIHFNHETYNSTRTDSLQAIKLLSEIISLRFGFFRKEHEWAIKGTRGAQFISKEHESDPFIRRFYIPKCPLVGPYYAVKFVEMGILFLDRESCPDKEISDDEFAEIFNNRSPDEVVKSDFPLGDDVLPVGILLHDGTYRLTKKIRQG